MAQLSEMRDFLEELIGTETGDSFIDSQFQLDLINLAARKTAYKYNWPQLLRRTGAAISANLDRYTLPTDLRKFEFVFQQGNLIEETSFDFLDFQKYSYSIGLDEGDIILKDIPDTSSTDYTTEHNESAGSSVTIRLDTVSGLAAGDKVYIDDVSGTVTSDEFAVVESVDSDNKDVVITLAKSHNSTTKIRKTNDVLYMGYQRTVTNMSATSDTPDTPDELDLIIPYYAAYLFLRASEDTRGAAEANLIIWTEEVDSFWRAFSKNSTGPINQFYI